MKVNELQLGDYVYNQYGKIERISSISDTIVVTEGDDGAMTLSRPEQLKPIPPTEEILVKNGFEKSQRWHNCTMRTAEDIRICIQFRGGGSVDYVTIMKHFNDLVNRDIDIAIRINYVHQLQHLFRLVGIEKEIEL